MLKLLKENRKGVIYQVIFNFKKKRRGGKLNPALYFYFKKEVYKWEKERIAIENYCRKMSHSEKTEHIVA